jgi:ketosteroid isomerase-like protein
MNATSIVKQFIDATQNKDLDALSALMDEQISVIQPMSLSGSLAEAKQFSGKEAVLNYLKQQPFTAFAKIKFVDCKLSTTNDGNSVFVEAMGDFLTATNKPYKNIYVLKFELHNEKVIYVAEYVNPITYALAFGLTMPTSMAIK